MSFTTKKDEKIITTERQKNHELAECPVIVTSLWDFENIGVNFLSTHIKSLTGLSANFGVSSVERWRIKCW